MGDTFADEKQTTNTKSWLNSLTQNQTLGDVPSGISDNNELPKIHTWMGRIFGWPIISLLSLFIRPTELILGSLSFRRKQALSISYSEVKSLSSEGSQNNLIHKLTQANYRARVGFFSWVFGLNKDDKDEDLARNFVSMLGTDSNKPIQFQPNTFLDFTNPKAMYQFQLKTEHRLNSSSNKTSQCSLHLKTVRSKGGHVLQTMVLVPARLRSTQEAPEHVGAIIHPNGAKSIMSSADILLDSYDIGCLIDSCTQTNQLVVSFNYRGVLNPKQTTRYPSDMVEDCLTQIHALKNFGLKEDNLTIHGHSLGGVVASLAAAHLHKNKQSSEEKSVSLIADRTLGKLSEVPGPPGSWLIDGGRWEMNAVEAYLAVPSNKKHIIETKQDQIIRPFARLGTSLTRNNNNKPNNIIYVTEMQSRVISHPHNDPHMKCESSTIKLQDKLHSIYKSNVSATRDQCSRNKQGPNEAKRTNYGPRDIQNNMLTARATDRATDGATDGAPDGATHKTHNNKGPGTP